MKKKEHIVKTIKPGSIAEELEITPGDKVLAIDNTEIEDIFDYQFLTQDTYIEMLVEKADGEQWLLEIDKEFDEDLGIEFENGLMDEYRHCRQRYHYHRRYDLFGRKHAGYRQTVKSHECTKSLYLLYFRSVHRWAEELRCCL